MIKKLLILSSLVFIGCGSHLRQLSQQQTFLVQETAKFVAERFDRDPNEYLSYSFIFVEEALGETVSDFCYAPYGIWGCTIKELNLVVVAPDVELSPTRACFVLVHEYAHITTILLGGDGDADHNDPLVAEFYDRPASKEFCKELAKR